MTETVQPLHGAKGDPRYPSPRRLRQWLAFAVDVLLHTAVAAVVFVGLDRTVDSFAALVGAVVAYILVSFIHRTLFQWYFHATTGKMLFGLLAIRPEDGRWLRFPTLLRFWGLGFVVSALSLFDLYVPDNEQFINTVRRCDVNAKLT